MVDETADCHENEWDGLPGKQQYIAMTVFAPVIGALWRTIESYGIDPCSVIDENVYRPGSDLPMNGRISPKDYDKAQVKALALVNDPAFGIRLAKYLHPSHLGALGHAWMASSSLKYAIHRLIRFGAMYNERMNLVASEVDELLKVETHLDQGLVVPDMKVDSHLAGLLALCRLNFGPSLLPAFVRMQGKTPPDPTPWHEYFGVKVQFNQPENCIAFRLQDVTKLLTGSSPMLVALHEDVIKRQIADLNRSDIINRAISATMEQLPSGGVSEASVASALNMTKRTLHRKLCEQGTSFRKILTGVRKEMVQRYLAEPTYSVTEISFMLGYTNTSAFSRAFRRWHGVSPTQARGVSNHR